MLYIYIYVIYICYIYMLYIYYAIYMPYMPLWSAATATLLRQVPRLTSSCGMDPTACELLSKVNSMVRPQFPGFVHVCSISGVIDIHKLSFLIAIYPSTAFYGMDHPNWFPYLMIFNAGHKESLETDPNAAMSLIPSLDLSVQWLYRPWNGSNRSTHSVASGSPSFVE